MKSFTGILVIVAVFAIAGQAGAVGLFTGDTFSSFETPSGGGGVYELLNGAYPIDMSSTLFSGTPFPDGGSRNEYTLTGITGFSTPENTPFAVADLFYHNGRTLARTSVTTVPVDVDVYFSNPAGVDRTFTFTFDFTLNLNTDDPVGSADTLTPVDVFSSTTFFSGLQEYTLELLGFSDDGGSTITGKFILPEDADTTSTLYGRIVPPQGGGGEEQPIAEPGALGLIGAALLALRKKRK